ncbi:MAG: ECF transporter S component [Epulopiscium sp.]|mgnify:CR=1 FL=1|nr:ECF transporter S component [Candidatus Epulonipiscium sp.]
MKEKKNNASTRKLVLMGLMIGISIILASTPLGLIPTPIVSATILHVPTIIMALLEGPIAGMGVGLAVGLATLVRALTSPTGVLDPLFINPFVSVFPRVLIGLSAYYGSVLGQKLFPKASFRETMGIIVGSALGSLTNTVGVLGMLALIYGSRVKELTGTKAITLLFTVAGTNGVMEIIVASILSVVIVKALHKIFY